MLRSRLLLAIVVCAISVAAADASLIVDPAQQITRQVTVQVIQTSLDNGTSPATVFGTAAQRAHIEAGLDTIWAQAGIDINVLPTITSYHNTFAYQGTAGSDTRPTGDLNTILTNAANANVLNSDSLTLNLLLVNVVPGFAPLNENTSAGFARIQGNGITGYVGDNLLTFDSGLDVISSVFAHEIGHNLGLSHTADGIANLMSPNGTSQQLTQNQITTARSATNFPRLYTPPPPITGDYNGDGVVNAADYIVWRKTLNQAGSGLPADGNNNGTIDNGDYTVWRQHYGNTSGSGAGLDGTNVAPEPSTLVLLFVAGIYCSMTRKRRG